MSEIKDKNTENELDKQIDGVPEQDIEETIEEQVDEVLEQDTEETVEGKVNEISEEDIKEVIEKEISEAYQSNEKEIMKSENKFKKLLNSKVGLCLISIFIGYLMGVMSAPSCVEEHDSTINDMEEQILSKDNLINQKDKEIESLNQKIKQADPWFKMEAEEQRKIEEENARIEAERIAKEEAEAAKRAEEEAKKAEEERIAKEKAEKNKYENGPTYNQVARNPDDYLFKLGKFKGKVVQVMEGDTHNNLRVAVDGDYNKMLLVEYDPSILNQRILEDDYVTIYGMNMGIYSYTSTMGAKISIPSMLAQKIDM